MVNTIVMSIIGKVWINLWIISGDLILIFTFVGLGTIGHKDIDFIQIVIRNFVPFGLAWVLITGSLITFHPSNLFSIKKIFLVIPSMIVFSSLVAIFVRALVFDTGFIWTFYLVAIGVQTVMIVIWRVLFLYILGNRLSGSEYN